ncbi:MAG: hypothetical protein JXR30_00895 [Alphaproteobacteria bacterium]|nr:hypothetical protein [Alphaproteobacteria bacterium]
MRRFLGLFFIFTIGYIVSSNAVPKRLTEHLHKASISDCEQALTEIVSVESLDRDLKSQLDEVPQCVAFFKDRLTTHSFKDPKDYRKACEYMLFDFCQQNRYLSLQTLTENYGTNKLKMAGSMSLGYMAGQTGANMTKRMIDNLKKSKGIPVAANESAKEKKLKENEEIADNCPSKEAQDCIKSWKLKNPDCIDPDKVKNAKDASEIPDCECEPDEIDLDDKWEYDSDTETCLPKGKESCLDNNAGASHIPQIISMPSFNVGNKTNEQLHVVRWDFDETDTANGYDGCFIKECSKNFEPNSYGTQCDCIDGFELKTVDGVEQCIKESTSTTGGGGGSDVIIPPAPDDKTLKVCYGNPDGSMISKKVDFSTGTHICGNETDQIFDGETKPDTDKNVCLVGKSEYAEDGKELKYADISEADKSIDCEEKDIPVVDVVVIPPEIKKTLCDAKIDKVLKFTMVNIRTKGGEKCPDACRYYHTGSEDPNPKMYQLVQKGLWSNYGIAEVFCQPDESLLADLTQKGIFGIAIPGIGIPLAILAGISEIAKEKRLYYRLEENPSFVTDGCNSSVERQIHQNWTNGSQYKSDARTVSNVTEYLNADSGTSFFEQGSILAQGSFDKNNISTAKSAISSIIMSLEDLPMGEWIDICD